MGLNQHDVAKSLLLSLSSSFQTAPSFWVNPANGIEYNVAVQVPQYKIDSMQAREYSDLLADHDDPASTRQPGAAQRQCASRR